MVYRIAFGPFRLTPSQRLLTRDGIPVEIGGRSLDLLIALVQQPGRVIPRQELLRRIWPDVVVEDGSLRFHMTNLRRILGDGEHGVRYIATQVGVGYAFVAAVTTESIDDSASDCAPPQTDAARADAATADATRRLPTRPRRVIGRDHEVQLLGDRIGTIPLLTIVGPAGVGKTTLAIEAAYDLVPRFADRGGFIDLASVEDAELIPSAIAGALDIHVHGADPLTVVLAHLRSRRLLLVLDNCEHLIDQAAAIIERIIDAAPQVRILATSREPLRLGDEHVYWLDPLDYPRDTTGLSLEELLAFPAVELFVARASAGNAALTVDLAAARLIADMCRRLDGMALPIELAAVRVASHGLRATSQLLGKRFSLGWTGRRTANPRHQTLQATLDWSYELLSQVERLTFERLSVFLGDFTLDAALDVITDGLIDAETAAAAFDELTAKSLVSPDRSIEGGSYRLFDMTRAYAKTKFVTRGEQEANDAARRHARHFLKELEAMCLPQRDIVADAAYVTRMLGNIRTALQWSFGVNGDPAIAARLASVSARAFQTLSLLVECRTWCERGVAILDDRHRGTPTELELQAALGLSLMFTRGSTADAETALRRALEIATALSDRWNQLRVLARLHIFHERIGDFGTASKWSEVAVQVAAQIAEPEAVATAASLAGISHHLAGDQTLARRELELALRQSLPSERGRTIYYGFDHRNRAGIALARVLWLQGYADQARRLAESTVREAARLEHPITHCIALIWSFSIEVWSGDLAQAQTTAETFANFAEMHALAPYMAAASGFQAELHICRAEAGDALTVIEDSLARLHAANYELVTTSLELALAQGMLLERRHREALALLNATAERCHATGELYFMPELLRMQAKAMQLVAASSIDVQRRLLDSLECSRNQDALGLELRAALDLARLWTQDQRYQSAFELLASVRGRFSEGFDTVDLREADALLQQLSRAGQALRH